jgi:hypothetical protein
LSYRGHRCKTLLGGGVWGTSSPPPPQRKASPSNVKLSDVYRERVTMIYGGAAMGLRAMSARALSGRLVSGRPLSGRPLSGRPLSGRPAAGGSPKHAHPGWSDKYAPLVLDGAARRPHSAAALPHRSGRPESPPPVCSPRRPSTASAGYSAALRPPSAVRRPTSAHPHVRLHTALGPTSADRPATAESSSRGSHKGQGLADTAPHVVGYH